MRLLKSIVNTNNDLVGFLVKAKEKELNPGSDTNKYVDKMLSLQEIIALNPNSSQFRISPNGVLVCKRDFKINTLPMLMVDNNNVITEVDNSITLVSRILVDGRIEGFRVKMPNGNKTPFKYKHVLMLANWYKPTNFTVRISDNKKYIVGLRGKKIEDLPEEEMKSKSDKVAKGKKARTSSKSVDKKVVDQNMPTRDASLEELIELARLDDGYIVTLPDQKYKRTTVANDKATLEFQALGIGDYGKAKLVYGEEKLNATIRLKKPGFVSIPNLGRRIDTFTWASKTVFVNGTNNLSRIGLGVKPDTAKKIEDAFGSELIAKRLPEEDEGIFRGLTLRSDLEFYEISCDKLDIITMDMAKKYANMSADEVVNIVKQLNMWKLKTSLAKEVKKQIESVIGKEGVINAKRAAAKIDPRFSGFSNEQLQILKDANINIMTGEFSGKQKLSEEESEKVNSATSIVADENVKAIKFDIAGTKPKLSVIADVLAGTKKTKTVGENEINAYTDVIGVAGSADNEESYNAICGYIENIAGIVERIKHELWRYKLSVIKANGGSFVTGGNWVEKQSTSKKYRVFKSVLDENVLMYVANVGVK